MMSGGQGGNGADPINGTGGQPGTDNVTDGTGAAGGNGGSSSAGSGGGAGGASGTIGGAGGNGGAAAGGTVPNTSGTGGAARFQSGPSTFQGNDGGNGRAGLSAGDGGGGGGGGSSGDYFLLQGNNTATFTRIAGAGGSGGAGLGTGGGGGGGSGGYGFVLPGSGILTLLANTTGGAGGAGGAAGGAGAAAGNGGNGGIGVFLNGDGISNTAIITGGAGGLGGAAPNGGTAGVAGQGGAGVAGANITVNNTGTIQGGFNGGTTTRADAIDFTGGTNILTPSTGVLNGGIGITGSLSINGANVTVGNVIHDYTAGAGSLTKSDGGTLTLTGTNTYTGSTTIAANNTLALSGTGSIANSSQLANAGTFDISATTAGASITTLSGGGGTNLGAQTLTIANGSTSYSGAISGTGGVAVTGGTQTLTGTSTYSGGTTIGSNGGAVSSTLQLGGPTSAGTGAITFSSMSGNATARLGLDVAAQPANGATFSNTIANFGTGNEIALAGLTNSSVSFNSSNSSITVTGTRSGGGQVSESFVLSAPRTTSFTAVSDGNGGTVIRAARPAPCYVTGTRIRLLSGLTIQDVPVERLRVGDLALTDSGKPRRIRWIGSRSYPAFTAPKHDYPVRVKAGALAEGVPARDLLVSPDHALMIDGLFVAAGHLVNGTTITRGEAVADLTYWHVELDSHDLLLAEGTPAESFLAAPGVRCGFDGVQALDAGAMPVPYALRAELGPELAALRGRLALRAISLSETTDLGPVRAWLDRCVIVADGLLHVAGWAQDTAHPNVSVCLEVLVDGVVVAFTVASEYRADLAAAGVGDGRVGFDLGLNVRLTPGASHVVEVRRSADGSLVCAKQVDAAGAWTALLAA